MKRGVIIIGVDEVNGTYQEEIIEDERHAEVIQKYCNKMDIQIDIPTENLNGYLWSRALANEGFLVTMIEEYLIILYIPQTITDFQHHEYEVCIKAYVKRKTAAYSYYNRNGYQKEILIEDENKDISWEMIDEEIEDKHIVLKKRKEF